MTTARTFMLPDQVTDFLDTLPPRAKSKYVSKAILEQIKREKKQDALDFLNSIVPVKNTTGETSVELVKKSRQQRANQLLGDAQP